MKKWLKEHKAISTIVGTAGASAAAYYGGPQGVKVWEWLVSLVAG